MPSAAQATAPGMDRTEWDMAEGSLGVLVLGERFAPSPLAPSITEGRISAGMSQREVLMALGADRESSLTLTSMGSGSHLWGEPLL